MKPTFPIRALARETVMVRGSYSVASGVNIASIKGKGFSITSGATSYQTVTLESGPFSYIHAFPQIMNAATGAATEVFSVDPATGSVTFFQVNNGVVFTSGGTVTDFLIIGVK